MQSYRLFGIVYLLLDKKRLTAQELAEHFEVSKRTILRDIDTLSMAGVPIYTVQGKGGGISILEGYVLDKAAISEQEQNHILMALQSLGATNQLEVDETIAKISRLFGKNDIKWIEVDFSRWGSTAEDKGKFELLQNAIISGQAITFLYLNTSGEKTQRNVYPLKLVFKGKEWYLYAYCRQKQDYRLFKLNRIIDAIPLHEYFEQQKFAQKIDFVDNSSRTAVELVLKFSAFVGYRVYDEFGIGEIDKKEDGTFVVTVAYPEDTWLYSFLLSFGAQVEVISPQHVKENLRREIERMYNANN